MRKYFVKYLYKAVLQFLLLFLPARGNPQIFMSPTHWLSSPLVCISPCPLTPLASATTELMARRRHIVWPSVIELLILLMLLLRNLLQPFRHGPG